MRDAFLPPGSWTTIDVLDLARKANNPATNDGAGRQDRSAVERVQISDHDKTLLRFVARGLSNTQMAIKMGIPESTVRSRMRRLLSKVDVSTRAEAVYVAARQGWI